MKKLVIHLIAVIDFVSTVEKSPARPNGSYFYFKNGFPFINKIDISTNSDKETVREDAFKTIIMGRVNQKKIVTSKKSPREKRIVVASPSSSKKVNKKTSTATRVHRGGVTKKKTAEKRRGGKKTARRNEKEEEEEEEERETKVREIETSCLVLPNQHEVRRLKKEKSLQKKL